MDTSLALLAKVRMYICFNQALYPIGKIVAGETQIRNLSYINHLETGDYSSTYRVWDGKTAFVLKHIFNVLVGVEEKISPEDIENEMSIQLQAAALGVAPLIEFAFLFDLGGVIVMECLDLDLKTYLITMPLPPIESISSDILNALAVLHSLNIRHGDCHNENIMFKLVGAGYKPYLIDYGLSIHRPTGLLTEDVRRDYYILMDSMDGLSAESEVSSIKQLANEIGHYVETRFTPDQADEPHSGSGSD